ncbi:hypothetical protein LEMLEM_LOCUS20061 [Lemmus lemmus]
MNTQGPDWKGLQYCLLGTGQQRQDTHIISCNLSVKTRPYLEISFHSVQWMECFSISTIMTTQERREILLNVQICSPN